MRSATILSCLLVGGLAGCLLAGCHRVNQFDLLDGGADGGDADSDGDADLTFSAVDMVLVVDNSGSMNEEQAILTTAVFTLFNSLAHPLPTAANPPLDDLRVAVVSTDMGLQWGGQPYEDGDGWPGTPPCTASGDNGAFQTYSSGKTVQIADSTIACDESAVQCPTGWSCEEIGGDGVGVCVAPDGPGENHPCPSPPSEPYAETTGTAPNDELAFQISCLSSLGTNGCGFEQQLEAAAKSLVRWDQLEFVREDALLAVLIVSDEGDCSIEDGPALFATTEIQDLGDGKVNVACGNHQDTLYSVAHYVDHFAGLKGGEQQAVVFGAIVGVPMDVDCEGPGNQITDCLDHPAMQLTEVTEGTPAAWFFEPACTRVEDSEELTRARPGRRFVELAQELGSRGYIYSICNADWGEAMEQFAGMIASKLE
jgi:hypothetical protein